MRNRLILTSVVVALLAAACSSSGSPDTTPTGAPTGTTPPITMSGSAAETSGETAAAATEPCPTTGNEFETAMLYIEHNAPDEDTGVHGLFGGAAWSELCIWDPTGELILLADPLAQLNDLAVADLFFESREPENSEVSIADILAAFPEGEYMVAGTDFEGVERIGAAIFTHDIPAEPEIVDPVLAEDPETASEATIPTAGLVVRWEPVTETIFGDPVVITAYEVIVTKEDHEDPNSLSRPVYDVHIGPDQTSLSVAADFLEPDTIYELEVLALEESGNQTIGLGFFTTADA